MEALPSLGDPAAVRDPVQGFAAEIIGTRAGYNADRITGELARSILAIAVEHENGRLSDSAAKENPAAGMDSLPRLLMGGHRN